MHGRIIFAQVRYASQSDVSGVLDDVYTCKRTIKGARPEFPIILSHSVEYG